MTAIRSRLVLTVFVALLFSLLSIAPVHAESADSMVYEATVEGMT